MLDFEHLRHILGPATQGHPKTLIENSLVSNVCIFRVDSNGSRGVPKPSFEANIRLVKMTLRNSLGSHRKEFREADKPPWKSL